MKEETPEKWRFRWREHLSSWRWEKSPFYVYRDCISCRKAAVMGHSTKECNNCSGERFRACEAIGQSAHTAVNNAIRRGVLLPAIERVCVDCGNQAQVYDHREYAKPLEVEPVCRSCNIRRGPAKDSPALVRIFQKVRRHK